MQSNEQYARRRIKALQETKKKLLAAHEITAASANVETVDVNLMLFRMGQIDIGPVEDKKDNDERVNQEQEVSI